MLHALKSKRKKRALTDVCVNVTCALKSKQNKRAFTNVYANVTCTEIETKEKSLYDECLCECYMHWNQNKRKEL